jgi:DNA-directed RNA polymerase specialized sigma24 family protein
VTFEQFSCDRIPALLATATAICGDKWLAEDLVQDVLIKIHRHWNTISGLDVPDAYVRKMLVNEFLSWRRKWSRITPHADVEWGFAPVNRTIRRRCAG